MQAHAAEHFDDWRFTARMLLAQQIPPDDVQFDDAHSAQRGLFGTTQPPPSAQPTPKSTVSVPKPFLDLARYAACHRDPDRWNLLYRILWRLTHGEKHLLEIETDDDVFRARNMQKQVRRDAHKMKAFVRFRRTIIDGQEWFVAWHRPDHHVVRLVANFFADRFPSFCWSVLTPDESMTWDMQQLHFGPGVSRDAAPSGDVLEDLWLTYYGSIFNPARIKLKMMRSEMPVRHWPTLPETAIIDDLLNAANARVAEMVRHQENLATASRYIPPTADLPTLRQAAQTCRGCDLCQQATQTVFGEGNPTSPLVLVGEQPGDEEDLAGRPFIGPAGQLLNGLLAQAGIDRDQIYITNAVKHFRHTLSGKRRLHKTPRRIEVVACRPWLMAELELIRPRVVLCLGATAAQSLISPSFRITIDRGSVFRTNACDQTIATFHPSALLRADDSHRSELEHALLSDLCRASELATLES